MSLNFQYAFTYIVIFVISISILGGLPAKGADDIVVDPPDVTKDKEVICDAIERGDVDIKVGISGMMDYDDLLRLTVWNSKYNLRSGQKAFQFKREVNWKRSILGRLGAIFMKACPNEFVDPQFVNAVVELFMIYQNSVNASMDHSMPWNALTTILDLCIANTEQMEMTSTGFLLTGLVLQVEDGTEEVTILPPEELADSSNDLDIIIDTAWWLFSLSFGNCYWSAENPSFWAARFKRLFYADFLHEFRSRWLHAGPNTEFGVILGDFPYETILRNIRVCVTAAYTKNGLADRQLVRPLTLAPPGAGIEMGLNKKIGKAL